MGYCEQDLASLLENMQTPFSEAQVKLGQAVGTSSLRGCRRSSPNALGTSTDCADPAIPGARAGLQQGWGAWGEPGCPGSAGSRRTLHTLSRLGFGLEQTGGETELGKYGPQPACDLLGGDKGTDTAGHPSGFNLRGCAWPALLWQRSVLLSPLSLSLSPGEVHHPASPEGPAVPP